MFATLLPKVDVARRGTARHLDSLRIPSFDKQAGEARLLYCAPSHSRYQKSFFQRVIEVEQKVGL